MPIIDPSIQLALCNNEMETIKDNNFFLYYLYHASRNIDRSMESVEAFIQFENDLKENAQYPNDLFNFRCDFRKDFENPSIHNFYECLFSKFRPEDRGNISEVHRGQYYVYENDKQMGDKIIKSSFFRPVLSKSNFHAWYFTDTPVAILCVNLLCVRKQNQESLITHQEIYLINLEIDLLQAAGFTLVLSFITDSYSINSSPKETIIINDFEKTISIQEYFFINTVVTHNFSEIHLNLTTNENISIIKDYDKILRAVVRNADSFNGHFYIYSPFFKGFKSDSDALLKILKNKPRFHIFNFSDDIRSALNLGQLIGSNDSDYKCIPFAYVKSGFDHETMRIMLCNVPLYSIQNKEISTMPSERSYLSWAYIKRDYFHSWTAARVPITVDDKSNTHQFLERFINIDDIHYVNPQFFVNDTLYLTRTSRKTLETINEIQVVSTEKTRKNDQKDFENEKVRYHINAEKHIENSLINVTYALQHKLKNTFLYKSQLFTAFEACKTCFSNEKDLNDKGFIYQVETGEGKSYIIRVISAVISLISQKDLFTKIKSKKKYVHVASSNIQLANRDYTDSREFFEMLGLSSAVLLHKNELPYYNDEMKKEEMKNDFPEMFFKDKLFENSSNMNYSVCGIDADGIKGDKADIVFSTFVNFESLYLRMMETCTTTVSEYFQNCYLLIDEADSILIDELANGTILSRSMKTNCEEVLKFVYRSKMDGRSVEEVYTDVRQKWPKCRDIRKEDIKDMFDDIDLVNQEEFTNGKKYSIETREEEIKDKNILEKGKEKLQKIKEKGKEKLQQITKKKKKSSSKTEENKEENIDTNNGNSNDLSSSKIDETQEENLELNNANSATSTSNDLTSSKIEENLELNNKNSATSTSSDLIIQQENDNDTEKKKHKHHHKRKNKRYRIYKEIVPFDYDHKGVLEPNKEFSGFVQQFIAIKEQMNDKNLKNLKIKDVSMNYLYVSHPIFVKLYKAVCGFTGTIGNKYDKQILKKQYQLITKKIPRNKPNRRIELPIILCSSLEERNRRIVNEVLEFHSQSYPVLVIFQDLNEISNVFEMLIQYGVEYINIFDGKDEKLKPDFISGRKGAVSLGTNVCGRGTDIKDPEKPLHVIISYFTSNSRVMQQAFGRTSRQGRDGTVSIICLREQFVAPIENMETDALKEILSDFQVKNEMQQQFIEDFRKYRSWIFDSNVVKQKIDNNKYIKIMRDSKINVNRIKAYNFEFPVCMSVQTFIIIQGQKIFSLYNCPNCLYTWILFQRYCRELILESWSLFIDRADKTFRRKKKLQNDLSYRTFLQTELEKIKPWLYMYLPIEKYKESTDQQPDQPLELRKFGMIDTFIEIFEAVSKWGQKKIESLYPKKLLKLYSPETKQTFLSFNVGFKPYSLIDNSGARISSIDGTDKKRNFISDPELKYVLINGSEEKLFSITRKIDGIFESICSKINEIFGNYTGLKFFLRRTLSGCEFGVCFDFNLENVNKTLTSDANCLFDLDPLFLFSITIKSIFPVLAGILIIGLIYIASISEKITQWVSSFPVKITAELIKKTVKEVAKIVVNSVMKQSIEKFCDKVIAYLYKIFQKQLKTLLDRNAEVAEIFSIMANILSVNNFNNIGDKIQDVFTENVCNVKIKPGFCSSFLECGVPVGHLLKIGLLLLLCFASFMMNFNCRKDELQYQENEVAAKYNKNQDTDQCAKENEKFVKNEDFASVKIEQ